MITVKILLYGNVADRKKNCSKMITVKILLYGNVADRKKNCSKIQAAELKKECHEINQI